MNTNIRIIKRSQRDAKPETGSRATAHGNRLPKTDRAAQSDNSRHAARDITTHVATWIKEFQQRHTPDPRRAFANLFVDPATSSVD